MTYSVKPLAPGHFSEVFLNHRHLKANNALFCYDMQVDEQHIGHIAVQGSFVEGERVATIHIFVCPEHRNADTKVAVEQMACKDLSAMLKDQGYDKMIANCPLEATGVIRLMEKAGMTVNEMVIGILQLT